METDLRGGWLRRPSALAPIAMSAAALAVIAIHVIRHGTARQADEGAAAHLWQLLMAGQVPVIAFYAIRWLPVDPKAILVLAVQAAAALAAAFPVWWFNW